MAFIFFQDLSALRVKNRGKDLILIDCQATTTEISSWTGLVFDAKQYATNPLKFYSGPEYISTDKYKEYLRKDKEVLTLNEGIAQYDSIKKARSKFLLEDFYSLIEEVSWI